MENMIIARFKDNETAAETDKLRQWDYGQTLRIEGLSLPDMVEVHFSIRDVGGDAERQIGTTKDGVTEVVIPDKMLENKHCKCSEYTIYAWVYLSDETSGQTEYDIRIPVETRSRPVDFAKPNQPDFVGQVMEKLNDVETLKADFDEMDRQKLTRPESAKAGQIFRVQAVNEDGTLVLEAVDMPSCDVKDVQIDGKSIVSEGVAEIPIAKNATYNNGWNNCYGVVGIRGAGSGSGAIQMGTDNCLELLASSNDHISKRYNLVSGAISSRNLDYAVKCAMCDGKGAAWTEDEQAAARSRMGVKDVFVAQRGVTKFAEIEEAYNSGKQVVCTDGWLVARLDILSPSSYAQFSGLDDLGNPVLLKVTKEDAWKRTNITKATAGYVDYEIIKVQKSIDTIGKYINSVDPMLSELGKMSAVNILKSVYSFRGGFCNNAGTLHIKNPGIYLIMQGGTGNKQIIINNNGTEVLNKTWNGIIILAYDSGVITPIGIETSLTIAGTFKMPGTFQGWTSDGSYSTIINYPSMCVVAYLGNSGVNYLK